MFDNQCVFMSPQTMFDLPGVVKFDPHTPRINLDSAKVKARQMFADELKNLLTQTFKEPLDDRLVKLKTGDPTLFSFRKAHTDVPAGQWSVLALLSIPGSLGIKVILFVFHRGNSCKPCEKC